MKNRIKVSLYLIVLLSGVIMADFPPAGMVVLDVYGIQRVSAKVTDNGDALTFEELFKAGINTVHFRTTTFGKQFYSQAEWVNDAHEYGMWVCGGGFSDPNTCQYVAGLGVDFIQMDEPYLGKCDDPFNETKYKQCQAYANAATHLTSCPILISEPDCANNIINWPSLEGYAGEYYNDERFHTNKIYANNYLKSHPNGFASQWVWLLAGDFSKPSGSFATGEFFNVRLPDSKFETWFSSAWNDYKNILLFIFNRKATGSAQDSDFGLGTNWSHRSAYMAKTTGLGETPPQWKNFSPASAVANSAPDCQVMVQSTTVGLDPASVQCFYSVSGPINTNRRWIRHWDVSAEGTKGTKEWVTIKAKNIPINNVSGSVNRVMFKITDTYPYKYYRGPRTFRRDFNVNISALDFTNLRNNGVVDSLSAAVSVDVQSAAGLDVTSASCEYSTDGGKSWTAHTAKCTGTAGSTGKETITADSMPFTEDRETVNRLRFSIKTSGGAVLSSAAFPVKVRTGPVISQVTPERGS
ncbi:MAG: hypothetical protein HQK83_20585, partial [Fibrobacteria bacterium]|nr:hypothetical protein [Fibrobacteria bacterium]